MKRYNKELCVLTLLLLLGVGNNVYSYEDITASESIPAAETQEKIKANKDTLSKAQSALDSKDFASAINYLNGYIISKPDKYEAYKLRGDAYYAIRRYDLAQSDYQKAVDIKAGVDKFSTNAKYVSAIVLGADKNEQLQNVELGNLYASLMYAQKALNNPAYTLSYDNAVKYNSHIYLPQQNKADINKINCPQKYAKQLNPTGVDATIASATEDIEKGDFHSSVFKIQNVISEYPNYFLGYYLMGVALVGLEKDDDAVKSFEKAISLNPYDFESYASLGQIYYDKAETNFSKEDSQKSVEYFKKALQLNRNCPTYYFYIGLNSLNSGDFTSAVQNFDSALRINENDYNSIYYKAIAQYINGDYNAVIAGTSKLLYKHVSNSNSVLYLRALAYNELGLKDKALADLEAIENNIGDVFNSDIKVVSKKDKAIGNYVNYLRSKIEKTQNVNAKTDDGTSNPIIKKLASVEGSLKPYESIINAKNITEEDYKKLENLYSVSLPKLLESGLVVIYDEIDTQYDFIRTTFSDIGVSFLPMTSETYSLTTIKDYYKKYAPKLHSQTSFGPQAVYAGMEVIPVQGLSTASDAKNVPTDKMLQAGESSLAQMLASNALVKVSEERIRQSFAQSTPQNTVKTLAPDSGTEFKPEIPDGEKASPAPLAVSEEAYVPSNKQLVDQQNMQKVKDIIAEDKQMSDKPKEAVSPINKESGEENGNIKISAKEIKETPNVEIKYAQPEKEIPATIKETSEKVESSVEQAKANITEVVKTAPAESVKVVDNTTADVKDTVKTAKEEVKSVQETVKSSQKQPVGNSPYSSSVYKGLSSAAGYDLADSKDVVELDLPSSVPNTDAGGVFASDRLGFGVGSKPVNSVFDTNLKKAKKNADKVTSEVKETVETAPQTAEETVAKIPEEVEIPAPVSQVQTIDEDKVAKAKEIAKKETTDVIVPSLIDENGKVPSIRANEQDTLINTEEIGVPEEKTEAKQLSKNPDSMLEEYNRLLKEQSRLEKAQKIEDAKKAREQAKALKLKAKEEQQQIKAEKLAQKAIERERIKEANLAAKEEMSRLKADEKAQKLAEKERIKEEKLALQEEVKAAAMEAKAQKAQAKEKLRAEKLAQKQEAETLKKEVNEAVNQTKVKKENVFAVLKNKLKKVSKAPEEKTVQVKNLASDKIKAQDLKEQRAQAKAQQKAKKAQERAVEKARRDLDKSVKKAKKTQAKAQKTQAKVQSEPAKIKTACESFTSKLKSKFQKFQKTPQEKAAQIQEREQKKLQNQQTKELRAKARAQQKAKKAQEKAQEKAIIEAKRLKAKEQKASEKAVSQKMAVSQKTKTSKWNNFKDKFKFKKKKQVPNTAINKYIQNSINPKSKPTKRDSLPIKI